MLIETGHYALVLALAVSLVQASLPIWGTRQDDRALYGIAVPAALVSFLLVAVAFAALTQAYLVSDFSVRNVAENSHSTKPLIYKISGVWGNHEGSMLLWVLILVLSGAVVALARRSVPEKLQANALAVQGMITAAFLLFVLVTSNPFERLMPSPIEGNDLNPLLQDPGLAIHPPLLYIGYVGFSITFAFAAAALIEGRIDAVWARVVRPWTLLAWAFLTLGIAMGSYWAYYELGWGGWWFWDPVENASLMPWLAGTALIHSVVVMEKRDSLKVWTILLAILTFSLSLLGAFIVRSGVLTSVHAFATDPERGVFILAILVLFIGGSLSLFAWRAPLLKRGGLFAPISLEGALVLNNVFVTAACATVFVGTLYPLALEAVTGEKISVGPPFFNATFGPLMAPLLLLLPFGQQLAWKRGDLPGVAQRLFLGAAIALAVALAMIALTRGGPVLAPLGIALGVFVVIGAFAEITTRAVGRGVTLPLAFRRALGLPRSAWGTATAHLGVGIFVLGVAATAFDEEHLAIVQPGQSVPIGGYELTLENYGPRLGPNYRDEAATFTVRRNGEVLGQVESAKRVYTARNFPTTEAGILTLGLSQVYVTLGETQVAGGVAARLFVKPFVLLLWIGPLLMAIGAFWSLTDRRFRVGAPKTARSSSPKVVEA